MYMTFWYMWNLPVNVRQEKNSGSIKIWFDPSLHRVFFTFLYHLSPTLPKALIHGDFRGGDRLFATYHRIYHLSPSTLILRLLSPHLTCYGVFHCLKQCVSRLETKCFITWNKLFQVLELIVSSVRNFSFLPLKL